MTEPPEALTTAIKALWRIPAPGPNNLLSAPAFLQLRDTCMALYENAGTKERLGFALSNALRSLGLPCGLVPSNSHLVLSPEEAAIRLDKAFWQSHGTRVYLCPLNMVDELLPMQFGPNTIRRYTAAELDALIDAPRLTRVDPTRTLATEKFSRFIWLVINEQFVLPDRISHRSDSILDFVFDGDWGRIEPHRERFAAPVEAALFMVLLAPWEDWVDSPGIDWLGFRVPWSYALDDNIFDRPPPAPSPDSLTWEPDILFDQDGEVVYEGEKPTQLSFNSSVHRAPDWVSNETWDRVSAAHQSRLFETPVVHFFVRAFCGEGVDEFLAHITTVEAALGLESDYKKRGATKRLANRVTSLLGAETDGDNYEKLFGIRSIYLHGRRMQHISGDDRLLARRLARRVVNALIDAALKMPPSQTREEFLTVLAK